MAEQAIEETEDEPDETTDETVDTDDNPEITEEETADLDAALDEIDPDDVDDTAADADDTDDAPADSSTDVTDGSEDDTDGDSESSSTSSRAWGEKYVQGLCTAANVAKDKHGDGGQVNPQMAFDLDLDEDFNEWLEEQGVGDDMPPGQAVLAGTCMFLVAECLTDEELVNSLLSEVSA